jgi:ankyrin repeat protein
MDENLKKAVNDGNVTEVKKLIAQGADLKALDDEGYGIVGCIGWSEEATAMPMCRMLLEAGASPDCKAYDVFSALALGCGAGDKQRVELLLDHGADPNIDSGSPLFETARWSRESSAEIVALLVARGADTGRVYKDRG